MSIELAIPVTGSSWRLLYPGYYFDHVALPTLLIHLYFILINVMRAIVR